MTEKITREKAREAFGAVVSLRQDSADWRDAVNCGQSYFRQPPDNDDAEVWKEIERLLHIVDSRADGVHWLCGLGDGTWAIREFTDEENTRVGGLFLAPTQLLAKLREMLKPPVPNLDDVEKIVERWEQLSHDATTSIPLPPEHASVIRRFVTALKEKENAAPPSDEPELESRRYISTSGWRYSVREVDGQWCVWSGLEASRIGTLEGPFGSRPDAQHALNEHAEESGWELVTT